MWATHCIGYVLALISCTWGDLIYVYMYNVQERHSACVCTILCVVVCVLIFLYSRIDERSLSSYLPRRRMWTLK